MKTTLISELYAKPPEQGAKLTVNGWIRTLRDSKAFAFIELNDGSHFRTLQVVCDQDLPNFREVVKYTLGSAIEVSGRMVLTPEMKQPFELKAEQVSLVGAAASDYPLQKKRHSLEFLRSIAHLRPRTNTFFAAFRIRSLAAQAIHSYFAKEGFAYIHTPIITTSDAEGAGEMFRVTTLDIENPPRLQDGHVDMKQDFFGKGAGLTVSGQLNAEALCMGLRNVYTFGPTFRAEHSNTPRHAAEFWMIEPEIAFADLWDDMALAEDMLKYIISEVMEKAPDEMAFLNSFVDKGLIDRLSKVRDGAFARVSYTEAIDILEKSGRSFEFKPHWGMDLQTEHERYLSEEHFHSPVFVYDYPKDIKAFYMRMNEDGRTVAATDLLVPGVGELIGGSQREEREDVLRARISEMGLEEESYAWYLDLRRYGSVPHAGFGLGFERLVMYLTGISNIRDAIPFPRTVGNAAF